MTPLTDKVDALFATWDRPDSPGCALAIIHDGEIIYKRGYGMADLERMVPISSHSVFDIGSTGKQFTAMLIAMLAKQGVLSLDDPIHRYLPEMPTYGPFISVRHLIHHTSGLRDYADLMQLSGMPFRNFYYEDELLDLICRQKELNFEPGDQFLYSNTGYFLLGIMARRATGMPFLELLAEKILEPLGMRATGFNDDARRVVKNRAIGYSLKDGDGYYNEISFLGGYGDGAILTTLDDLYLWDESFYNCELGGEELVHEALTPGELNSGERIEYALGLFITRYRGLRTVRHAGGWAGYRSEFIRFPDQKFSVICLANLTSINPSHLACRVADLYMADHFPETEQPSSHEAAEVVELPAGEIDSVVGCYRNRRTGSLMVLSTHEGGLVGEVFGHSFRLTATGPTCLRAIESPFELQIALEGHHPDGARTVTVTCEGRKQECYRKITATPIPSSRLSEYAGDYRSDELDISYRFLPGNGQLFLKRGYSAREPVHPITQGIFTSDGLSFEFERNEQHQVCGFRLGADRVRNIRFYR